MKKIAALFILTFLIFSNLTQSQTLQKPAPVPETEHAKYLKGDLTEVLKSNIRYPKDGLIKNIQGDVITSFIINRNGKLDSLGIINSPDILLSTNSLDAFNALDNKWKPYKINGQPISRKYLVVFRYRTYMDAQPPDYEIKAEKFFKKQKYDKALKCYNEAIKDNKYNFELFESRSRLKEVMGDTEGAKLDRLLAANYKESIISIVDIEAILHIETKKVLIRTEVHKL